MYRQILRTVMLLPTRNGKASTKNFVITLTMPNLVDRLQRFNSSDPPKAYKLQGGSRLSQEIDARAQKHIDEYLANNPGSKKFMKILELEIEVQRQEEEKVPSTLRPRDMWELLKLKSSSARRKFLEFLWENEKKKERRKEESKEILEELKICREKRLEEGPYDYEKQGMQYGFGTNFLFRKYSEMDMNRFWNWNVLKSIMYGNSIVLDFGFEKNMTPREVKNCSKQIMHCYADNRKHLLPFHLHFCEVDFAGPMIEYLYRYFPNLYDTDFPVTMTSQSYMDVFDRKRLVYLTPHTNDVIEKYDPNAVYIIGALVDKSQNGPLSLAKAKQQGITMKKLPLDKYVRFGDGSGKNLPINQVMNIMLDSQCYDWPQAFRHVPLRKLEESRVKSLEARVKREMFYNSAPLEYPQTKELKDEFFNELKYKLAADVGFKKFQSEGEQKNNESEEFDIDFSHGTRVKRRNKWSKMS